MSSKESSSTPPCGATPRRSNLGLGGGGGGDVVSGDGREDRMAPLGFEPEGSAASGTPPMTEISGTTPPFYKWVENIHYLLEDVDGVELFSRFLEQEDIVDVLPFYFAVKGLRDQTLQSKPDKIQQLIKLIFKKYLRGDRVMLILKPDTKKAIQDKMTNKDGGRTLEPEIFDDAQEEVIEYLSNAPYSAFLKSDLYLQYVQSGGLESNPGESVESSGSSSSAGSHAGTRPVSQGFLPTLHENEELELSDAPPSTSARDLAAVSAAVSAASLPPGGPGAHRSSFCGGGGGGGGGGVNVMPLSLKSLMATRHSRSGPAGEYPTSQHRRNVDAQGRSINPYHMTYCSSYNPVSAQDSELQSLSSDALTDTDTLGSLTDSSSVDRYPVVQADRYRKRQVKQEHRAIRHSAAQNQDDLVTHHRFIPRTERLPKDVKPTAETDFDAFAKDLTQRLEKVLEKQMKEEKLDESLRMLGVPAEQQHHGGKAVVVDDHGAQPPPVPRKTGIPTSASIPGGTSGMPSFKGLLFSSLMASRGGGGVTADPGGGGGGDDDEAQAILDEHVSKWDKSGHHTPSRARSPPNGKSGPRGGGSGGGGLSSGLPPRHRRHKGGASSSGVGSGSDRNTDTSSLISKDSGVSKDYLIPYQGNQDHHGAPEATKSGFHVGAYPPPGHPHHAAFQQQQQQQQQQQMAYFKNQGSNQGFEMLDPAARNVAAFRSQGGPPPTALNVNMMGGRSKSRLTVHSIDTGSSCVDSGVSGVYVGGASAASNSEGQSGGPKPLPYSEKVIAWMQDNENFSSDYKKSGSSYEASEGRSSARNRSDRGNNNNNGDHRSDRGDSRKVSASGAGSGGGQGSQSPALHRSERGNKRAVAAVAPTMPMLPPGANGNHPTSYHHFGPPGTPLASNSAWPTSMTPTTNEMTQHRHAGSGSTTRQASAAASLMNEKTSKKSSASSASSMNPSGIVLHASAAAVGSSSSSAIAVAQLVSPSSLTASSPSSAASGALGLPSASSSATAAPATAAPASSNAVASSSATVCGYYFCGEPIPYRVSIPGKNPTLAQFKSLLNKKGNFRFFFKKPSDEFDSGVIFAEISDDAAPLPYWEGKIVGKVERLD